MKNFKKCFYCKKNYPLFLFNINNCTYQVKADKGRTVSCRFCSLKRGFQLGGFMKKTDNKFLFVEASKIELIKKFLIGK
jgi:hypothetical protein